jgi:phenylalanyl-tRNA synthetase beta subunit
MDGLVFEYFHISLFTNSFQIRYAGKVIGAGGKTKDIWYTELYLDELPDNSGKIQLKLWPKNPPQIEDLTIKIPPKTEVGKVIETIRQSSSRIAGISLKDKFGDAYTFRISYLDPEKTLTDREVEKIRNKVMVRLKKVIGSRLRSKTDII